MNEDVVTEAYFAVVTPRGRYRYVCDGAEMRRPMSLYDSREDVARYGHVHDGDVVELVVFTSRYWVKRSSAHIVE